MDRRKPSGQFLISAEEPLGVVCRAQWQPVLRTRYHAVRKTSSSTDVGQFVGRCRRTLGRHMMACARGRHLAQGYASRRDNEHGCNQQQHNTGEKRPVREQHKNVLYHRAPLANPFTEV